MLREIALLRPVYRRALELKCRGFAYRDIAHAARHPARHGANLVHREKLAVRAKYAATEARAAH